MSEDKQEKIEKATVLMKEIKGLKLSDEDLAMICGGTGFHIRLENDSSHQWEPWEYHEQPHGY